MYHKLLLIKIKQALPWLTAILVAVSLLLLMIFKDSLNSYTANMVKNQMGANAKGEVSAYIDSTFNYKANGSVYQITFLEFGATGCAACRKMEAVMDEIEKSFPYQVNVVFLNILKPENQELMKYFGVVAIPTQVILNREAREVFRHTGYIDARSLSVKFSLNE